MKLFIGFSYFLLVFCNEFDNINSMKNGSSDIISLDIHLAIGYFFSGDKARMGQGFGSEAGS